MSFLNNQGQSDPVFKKPSGFPSRSRKNFNNTQSSCNSCKSEGVGNHQTLVQQVGERLVVLEKICQDRPENLTKILTDTIDHLNAACYSQLAEKLLSPSNTQVSSFGGSECSTRSSVLTAPFNYAPSIANNQEFPFESTRRRNNSTATSGNRYGLLNSAIPENRPINFPSEQFSRVNNVHYEPEPPARTVTKKPVRSKKNIASTTDHVEKQDLAPGLSIPFRNEKPNPPAAPPKPPFRKQLTEIKELEVLPSEDDDSLSQFFGRRRNVKQTTTAASKQNDQYEKPTTSRDLSVSLQRTELGKEREAAADALRKRKASQTDEDPSKKKAPVVEKRPSPDTTMPNPSEQERAEAADNNTLRRSSRNASILSTRNRERVTKSKENKENKNKARTTTKKPKSQKEAKNADTKTAPRADKGAKRASAVDKDAASTKNDEGEMFDEESFFGDVSSIVGSNSLVLTNTIAKNITKHSAVSQTDGQSHFFSPFVNVRSTSGVSAISTPLSKTLTKNVLGKRVKKPNAVAEFKNAQSRKPRRANAPATDVAPVPEHSAESSEFESAVELECSDFSD